MEDPFERFERSRGGLLIPVLLFLLGMVPTAIAIRAMGDLEVRQIDGDTVEGDVAEIVPMDQRAETGENRVDETTVAPVPDTQENPDTQEDAVP